MKAILRQICLAVAVLTSLALSGCATTEPRPEGVSWRVMFSVSPLYPKSFEITTAGPRSFSADDLKKAWQKKALLVANGRHFRTSPLIVHDNESIPYGTYWPTQTRSVTGTITLTD